MSSSPRLHNKTFFDPYTQIIFFVSYPNLEGKTMKHFFFKCVTWLDLARSITLLMNCFDFQLKSGNWSFFIIYQKAQTNFNSAIAQTWKWIFTFYESLGLVTSGGRKLIVIADLIIKWKNRGLNPFLKKINCKVRWRFRLSKVKLIYSEFRTNHQMPGLKPMLQKLHCQWLFMILLLCPSGLYSMIYYWRTVMNSQ